MKSFLPVVPTPESLLPSTRWRVGFVRLALSAKPGPRTAPELFYAGEGKYFVDLPGYGFAKAPEEAIRSQWEGLIGPYLEQARTLVGLVVIMDSRRPFTDLDIRLIDWFRPTGRPIHPVVEGRQAKSAGADRSCVRSSRNRYLGDADLYSVQLLFSSLKRRASRRGGTVLAGWLGIELKPGKTKGPRIRGPGQNASTSSRHPLREVKRETARAICCL